MIKSLQNSRQSKVVSKIGKSQFDITSLNIKSASFVATLFVINSLSTVLILHTCQ